MEYRIMPPVARFVESLRQGEIGRLHPGLDLGQGSAEAEAKGDGGHSDEDGSRRHDRPPRPRQRITGAKR